jgi:protein involved in polysaccharide export with SLBB domain
MNRTLPVAPVSVAAVLLLVAAAIDVAGQQPAAPLTASIAISAPSYRLTAGDVMDVKFAYNPELNETVTVRPDGRISLQMIGDVQAQTLTPLELAANIDEKYSKVLRHPAVSVIVREFAGQKAYVGGEVVAPGTVELRGGLTSLQAILKTGGLKSSAKLDSVILIRYAGEQQAEARKLNLKRVLEGRETDPMLSPYDVVFVPRSAIAKVGLFVQQYVDSLIPGNLMFPYNLNTSVTVK